jgi:hypothetical protein
MAKCLMLLEGQPVSIAPSFRPDILQMPDFQNANKDDPMATIENGSIPLRRNGIFNPTVLPVQMIQSFHFTFLIHHPCLAIPSLYNCSIPPRLTLTGWNGFNADSAGYMELRILFDYFKASKQIGPNMAGVAIESVHSGVDICVLHTEDLLANPKRIVETYCKSVGVPFALYMIRWYTSEDQEQAQRAFQQWASFHDAALASTELMA